MDEKTWAEKEKEYTLVIKRAMEIFKEKGFRLVKLLDEGRDADEYGDAYGPDLFSIVEER